MMGKQGGWIQPHGTPLVSTDTPHRLMNPPTPTARHTLSTTEDVDFITGGGPSEAASLSGPSAEQQAMIQRRVLIGGLAAVGLGAFALIPTKDLRIKPSKPLYFYLTGLLGVQVRTEVVVGCGVVRCSVGRCGMNSTLSVFYPTSCTHDLI